MEPYVFKITNLKRCNTFIQDYQTYILQCGLLSRVVSFSGLGVWCPLGVSPGSVGCCPGGPGMAKFLAVFGLLGAVSGGSGWGFWGGIAFRILGEGLRGIAD